MYMLKHRSFWDVKAPSQCSWYWKKLLHLRDIVRPLLKHKIGTGCDTFLWFDNWHPLGPLLDRFGYRVIYDAALPLTSKVKDVIAGGEWRWPRTNTIELMEIREHIHELPLPTDQPDKTIWIPSPNGQFSTAHTWDHLIAPSPKVPWHRLIWFPGNTPRHSFISWLAILQRLSTHDRIYSFTPGPLACVFCHSGMESHDHLFFNCSYSNFIWQGLLHRMDTSCPAVTWESIVNWAAGTWRRKTTQHTILKMCLGAAIYGIWKERNARTFKFEAKPKDRLLLEIKSLIACQIQCKRKNDPQLSQFMERWR